MPKPSWRLTASAKASEGELWGGEWRATVFMTASKSYSQWKHRSHLSLGFLLLRLFCSSELLLTELFEKKHRRLFLGCFFMTELIHKNVRKKDDCLRLFCNWFYIGFPLKLTKLHCRVFSTSQHLTTGHLYSWRMALSIRFFHGRSWRCRNGLQVSSEVT